MWKAALFAMLVATPAMADDHQPKNIIVMIADGAGYNMLGATRQWTGEPLVVDGHGWRRAALATYALRREQEGEGQDQDLVYTSAKAWDARPQAGQSECDDSFEMGFVGYEWHRCTYPDSAGTMTAMMTGVRSYNGALNVDGDRARLVSAAELAKAADKRVGAVSSVPFTHATPAAGGGAHNISRRNYHAIANELLTSPTLDFIAGGGHPDYDMSGLPHAEDVSEDDRFEWLSPADWAGLQDGSLGWRLIEDRTDIVAGDRLGGDERVIILPRVGGTLQAFRRRDIEIDVATTAPGDVPLTATVPVLTELTRAALSHLAGDDDGLFLVVEGGAVDWAMHQNVLGRAIEEYMDFDASVRLVSDWISEDGNGSSWDDTLLIVTADHDHLLFGPDADVPFQPTEDRGEGVLPGHRWWFSSHSNQLVPFFAKGLGAETFMAAADEMDLVRSADGVRRGRGLYLTQPEMGRALVEMIDGD
ncbi:MAG: alkaline phosphatase [Pacificimonas sp.]